MSLIRADAASTNTPLLQNFRQYSTQLIRTFWDQPNIARSLSRDNIGVQFDGRVDFETTTMQDVEEASYSMVPGESHTNLRGKPYRTKMPQIHKSCRDFVDNWQREFGWGNQRLPTLMARLRQKVKNKEDLICFGGDAGEDMQGFLDAGTQLTSTGSWATDADADGILENAIADFKQIRDAVTAIMGEGGANTGLPRYKIDFAITFPAFDFLDHADLPARMGNNLDLVRSRAYFGEFFTSNNVLPTASGTTDNALIGFVRTDTESSQWALLSSEIRDEAFRDSMYTWQYGVREKFALHLRDVEKTVFVIKDISLV